MKSSYHHLYTTARWRKRRKHQLSKHPLCKLCGEDGRVTAATVADHVIPHKGDPEKFYNGDLQSLCDTCHSKWKQIEERSPYGPDPNGYPTDPNHHWNCG